MEALEEVLLNISEMVCELPWLQELDLNPLIVDENGAIAADARIVIDYAPTNGDRYSHMAIHPYPSQLAQDWEQPDGRVITIRPIRPEDAEMEQDFVKSLSEESKYYRFMDTLRELTPAMLVRFTQIDYDREMALIATLPGKGDKVEQIGVARYVTNPDGETVEFALAVADDWQMHGVGRKLMTSLIECRPPERLPRHGRRRADDEHQDVPADDHARLHGPAAPRGSGGQARRLPAASAVTAANAEQKNGRTVPAICIKRRSRLLPLEIHVVGIGPIRFARFAQGLLFSEIELVVPQQCAAGFLVLGPFRVLRHHDAHEFRML
jgi:GNAT superfamily N-acetyltransferase